MCSGSEAGSYLRRIDFVYHSTLGLSVIKRKRRSTCPCGRGPWRSSSRSLAPCRTPARVVKCQSVVKCQFPYRQVSMPVTSHGNASSNVKFDVSSNVKLAFFFSIASTLSHACPCRQMSDPISSNVNARDVKCQCLVKCQI